jgi:hypothetical protein
MPEAHEMDCETSPEGTTYIPGAKYTWLNSSADPQYMEINASKNSSSCPGALNVCSLLTVPVYGFME